MVQGFRVSAISVVDFCSSKAATMRSLWRRCCRQPQHMVDVSLGKRKSRGCFHILCFIYDSDLFCFGEGRNSAVNKLRHQNLLGLCFAGVHSGPPSASGRWLSAAPSRPRLSPAGHHLLQTALRCLVDLDEVRVQLLGQQQLIVNSGARCSFRYAFRILPYLPRGFSGCSVSFRSGI